MNVMYRGFISFQITEDRYIEMDIQRSVAEYNVIQSLFAISMLTEDNFLV
jgi:hypothetical protein